MFVLSAFADEISPDPREQIAVLKACNIRHIEFRSIYATNVLKLSDAQIQDFQALLTSEGMGLSAIGSPIGKVAIDLPFAEHLTLFQRALDLAHRFGCPRVRIFSYYPPANTPWTGDWSAHRNEVIDRMAKKTELAAKAGVTLLHENEHNIFGDQPQRVHDMLATVNHPALRAAYDAANWVFCGYDPKLGWDITKDFTTHFHIKDWKTRKDESSHGTGVLPGHGDGHIAYSLRDAVQRGYHGFAVMEPHLRGGGPTGGVTGPDLFPVAVQAFRNILLQVGGQEATTLA
jgi:sugar phosphate isomerase/epimerase